MPLLWFLWVFSVMVRLGNSVYESTNIEDFKAVMQKIFIHELGEDLRRKLELISNEGVSLKKTNHKINTMVNARLTPQEKQRMKKAFAAIAGPIKDLAAKRAKGEPMRVTRSSQFKTPTKGKPKTSKNRKERNKNRIEL